MKKYNITLWLLVLYYLIYFLNTKFIEEPKRIEALKKIQTQQKK